MLFAVAALPGSLLIASTGSARDRHHRPRPRGRRRARSAARPAMSRCLFITTIGMGAGVVISQPAVAALIRRWLPARVGLATAIYTNGLLVGEILPVALFPPIMAAVDQSWRATFLIWAVPVLAIAVVAMCCCRAAAIPRQRSTAERPRWWPDWRDPEIWRVGFVFGSANTMYFASNAFLPGQLAEVGRPDLLSARR